MNIVGFGPKCLFVDCIQNLGYTTKCITNKLFSDVASSKYYLQIIDEEGIQQKALDLGTYMMLELAKAREEIEIIGDVRGKGLMIGVEMVVDKVIRLLLTGWYIRTGNVFSLCVSVTINASPRILVRN